MRLRNKKTGEIRLAVAREDGVYLYNEITEQWHKYELDILAEWWEYYEEPKEYWFIGYDSQVECISENDSDGIELDKSIGNYFETKEEAEFAVEKLKALTRLKDKGFRFEGWEGSPSEDDFDMIFFTMKDRVWDIETQEALDLLFGDEE